MSINIIKNSNKGIFEDLDGKNNLLVTFGGIRQGLGIPVFEFFNSISDIDCDKIFIRDFEQAWYQKGIDLKINSLKKIIKYLESIIVNKNYKTICFMGNSMGGFAAILFGVILNVDRVISFSPQTFIDRWNRFIFKDTRWKEKISLIYQFEGKEKKFFDLKKYLKQNANYKTKISIYYSTIDHLDKNHAVRMKKLKNICLHPIDNGDHNVVKIIRNSGELQKIIIKTFKGKMN